MRIPKSILDAGISDQGYGLWFGNGRLTFESPGLTIVTKQDCSGSSVVRVGNPKALLAAIKDGYEININQSLLCRSRSREFRLRAEEDFGHRMDILISGHVPFDLSVAKILLSHLLAASHFGQTIWVGGERLKNRLVSVIDPGALYVGTLPAVLEQPLALHSGNSRIIAKLFPEPTKFFVSQRSTLVSNGEYFAQSQHLESPVPVKVTKFLRGFRSERLHAYGKVLSDDLFPVIHQASASCERSTDLVRLRMTKDSLEISMETEGFAFQSEIPGDFQQPIKAEIPAKYFAKVQHLLPGEINIGNGESEAPHLCFFQEDRTIIVSRSNQ